MTTQLTIEQFKKVMPPQVKKNITQELVDKINTTFSDPDSREYYRDNLLSYGSVMADGRFKIDQYLNAVRYVSFKLIGDNNDVAYIKTFPDKYNRFLQQGISSKDIASYTSAYNKSKLVNLIFEQTLVPTYVLNADLHQKALNVQAELMTTAKSEKVRSDAANSLLTHLKVPETKKIELDLGIKQDKGIDDLRAATLKLVQQQKDMMTIGSITAEDVASSNIIELEGE